MWQASKIYFFLAGSAAGVGEPLELLTGGCIFAARWSEARGFFARNCWLIFPCRETRQELGFDTPEPCWCPVEVVS